MELLSLPSEIIVSIFSFLSPKYIKKVRLVCRDFCSYSSQYLKVDSVFAGSQTKTLERLEEIAQHDVFSKTVTTVVYATCSLRRGYETVDEYYEHLQELKRPYSEDTIPTKEQCKLYWGRYQDIYNDQVRVLRDGSDKARIAFALQRLPNLKHLVLSCTAWESPTHPLHAAWEAGQDAIIKPTFDPDDGLCQVSHGLELMSSAFIANNIRPQSLIQTGLMFPSDLLRSNYFTTESRPFFEPLHKLSLHFSSERSFTYLDMMKTYIFAAKRLEHLKLHIEMLERQPAFTGLLSSSWPNLTSVSLTFDLDYEPFVAFCRKHETVRSLRLELCDLYNGTWEELVPIMRDCFRLTDTRIEVLTEFDMQFVWTSSKDQELNLEHRLPEAEHYLVHGGENPFRNGALELVENL